MEPVQNNSNIPAPHQNTDSQNTEASQAKAPPKENSSIKTVAKSILKQTKDEISKVYKYKNEGSTLGKTFKALETIANAVDFSITHIAVKAFAPKKYEQFKHISLEKFMNAQNKLNNDKAEEKIQKAEEKIQKARNYQEKSNEIHDKYIALPLDEIEKKFKELEVAPGAESIKTELGLIKKYIEEAKLRGQDKNTQANEIERKKLAGESTLKNESAREQWERSEEHYLGRARQGIIEIEQSKIDSPFLPPSPISPPKANESRAEKKINKSNATDYNNKVQDIINTSSKLTFEEIVKIRDEISSDLYLNTKHYTSENTATSLSTIMECVSAVEIADLRIEEATKSENINEIAQWETVKENALKIARMTIEELKLSQLNSTLKNL